MLNEYSVELSLQSFASQCDCPRVWIEMILWRSIGKVERYSINNPQRSIILGLVSALT